MIQYDPNSWPRRSRADDNAVIGGQWRDLRTRPTSSLPGLARQSIILKRLLTFSMDARVEPAHDESIIDTADISPASRKRCGAFFYVPME